MNLQGAGVVVTGAGSGIGRALAVTAAERGARVVVSDLDATAAGQVAEQVGGLAVPGDLGTPDFPARLVEAGRAELGAIDLVLSNAGVDVGKGPDPGDDAWATALDVNLLAHVRLARALLPGWVEAGRGHLVVTASAAGLLTMIGNAPYSVSKHAAVALAEWLAIEHGDQGVTVQALCPQGVNTRMLQEAGSARGLLSQDGALEPDDVARLTLDSLDSGEFLILPHPAVGDYYRARAEDTDRWLAGMRRLRRRTLGSEAT